MKRACRSAFVLTEILVALALLSAFALIASRLFTTSMRTIERSSAQLDTVVRFDGMLRALRDDVWNASQVLEVKADQLLLRSDDGETRWSIAGDGRVTRMSGAEARAFPALTDARFARPGKAVELVVKDESIVLPNLKEMISQ